MNHSDILQSHLETIGLPADAVRWLVDMWQAIQTFDDVADGDAVSRGDLDRALWSSLCGLQMNPFHVQNAAALVPVVALQILKWHGSDVAERAGAADARSYMWRAGFYDLVLMVTALSLGVDASREKAALIMGMYGETLPDYLKEFPHA